MNTIEYVVKQRVTLADGQKIKADLLRTDDLKIARHFFDACADSDIEIRLVKVEVLDKNYKDAWETIKRAPE